MSPAPIRVLLIEDQPTSAVLLEDTLAAAAPGGFQVTPVERLAEALQLLAQETFDVILADLGLPDSTGAATFNRLRKQAGHLPIIVLTGLDDEELAMRTVHAGAQDYLVKGRVPGDLLVRSLRYSIERKRITDELVRRNEQMAEELALAREFQLAFLPRNFPTFPAGVAPDASALRFHPTYRPTGSIGGDFYTVFPVSPTQAGVFLCDVMGHGVQASLVTAMIRGLVEEFRPQASAPDQFMGTLNQSLGSVIHQSNVTLFVTALYVIVDAVTGQLRWTTAGHPAPWVIDPSARRVAPLTHPGLAAGPVLGLFDNATYPVIPGEMSPGQMLLLFTDGLFEAPNSDDVEFGLVRLHTTIQQLAGQPPPKLLDGLLREVQRFAAPRELMDDVCLLGVEYVKRL